MRAKWFIAGLLMLVAKIGEAATNASDQTPSAQLPLEARSADTSGEEDVISTSYVLPNQIFNDGKPYYARQDPISGQLDFTAKKPAGIEPEANEVLNSKEKIVLNGISTPNIHDFLNLPVKYSSSKFVYPLVSSSYANLKYQGSNKNYITNKKPTMVVAPVTPVAPKYHSDNYFTMSTTKLTAVSPTETTSTQASTSSRPTKPSVFTTRTTTTRPTTTRPTTTTTRRPTPVSVTTTNPPIRFSTTRKKFVPAKKQNVPLTTIPTTIATPSEQHLAKEQPKPTQSSSAVTFTTHHPTPQADIFPTEPTTSTKMYSTPSVRPMLVNRDNIGYGSTTPRAITTVADGTKIPNLDPADVYHTLGQKNEKVQQEQSAVKPAMTLSEIFNNLAEEESAVAHNYQQNQGFDAQGNLIEPIAPSQPSPFAMQSQQPQQSQHPYPVAMQKQKVSPEIHSVPAYPSDEKVISSGSESYDNQYVSYQVQQPNVMQYRPIPGQINNVVISPGQQSASFVLGSQQQVSHPGSFGNAQSDGLYPKETGSVQYGQVINEEINIQRPLPPNQQQHQLPPKPQQPTPSSGHQQRPNYNPNTKFQSNANNAPAAPATTLAQPGGAYQEQPPEAPSPYQQLPLIGSNLRPLKKQPTQIPDETLATGLSSPNQPNQALPSTMPTSAQTQTQPVANSQDTKELLVSTNIRFPSSNDDSLEISPSGVAPGPPSAPHINGHAQPLSLQQIQNANPVVFPKIGDEAGVQIQQHEVVNIKQHEQQLKFPTQQQNKNEQPSQEMEPPPRYAPLHSSQASVKRPNEPPSAPFYKEFDRKSHQPQAGPRPNLSLPNILPQFRPNAKISIGHNQNLKQEPGNIRLPTQGMKLPFNPSTPPQFSNRRQPMQHPQLQNRYPLNRIAEYEHHVGAPHTAVNRRVYRLPPNGGQRVSQLRDRMYARRPNGPLRAIDGYYPVERHAPITPQPTRHNGGDLEDYEEDDLVINDPPQTPNKDIQNTNESKLEAVVTLQMLQSQKKTLGGDDTGAGEIQVTADNNPQEALATKVNEQIPNPKSKFASQVENKATINEEAAASATVEYQNTPFSVIREQPQEPILKNKKPQSLQQHAKVQSQHKQNFPYPIEKPDPSYTELQPGLPVPGVLVAPRIITGALNTGTEAPIAIAYTPTEPNSFQRISPTKQDQKPLNANYGPSVLNNMKAETQTEEVLGNDFDIRGHNYEKDFMAPFYPSVSLGGAGNGVTGNPALSNWKIVPPVSDQNMYEKNSINRADVEVAADQKELEPKNYTDVTTEKYSELDSFQPQLQGGFRPIFPADYKHPEERNGEIQPSGNNDKPIALALVRSQPTLPQSVSSAAGSSTSAATTTTTTITPLPEITKSTTAEKELEGEAASTAGTTKSPVDQKPTKQKKSTFETSLAALLFGDADEFEDGARKSFKSDKAPARPINVARMGPRSLVLS